MMIKNNSVLICRHCITKLADFGSHCTFIVENACINHFGKMPLLITQEHELSECIKFLELKGYIVTTESDQYDLFIAPNTIKFNKKQKGYCWCDKKL
jgi:hypothetical protein